MKSKGMVLLVAGLLVLGLVGGAVWANDTTYDPSTKTIEGNLPSFLQSYILTITSPTEGNFSLPQTTDIKIESVDRPDGVSVDDALSLVTAAPLDLTFTAKGQEKTVTIIAFALSDMV